MSEANKNTHPKKEFSWIIRNGLEALGLANSFKGELSPRLPPTLLAQLETDLTNLGAHIPGVKQAQNIAQTATLNQDESLARGYALVSAVRTALGRSEASAETRKAYGVGLKVNPKMVKDVLLALGVMVDRATKNPGEAAELGLLASDVTALSEARAAVEAANAAQEKERTNAPLSTKLRNETARRIMAAVDKIVGAGVIQFAQNPAERERFEALIGKGNANVKGKEKKGQEAKKVKEPKEG